MPALKAKAAAAVDVFRKSQREPSFLAFMSRLALRCLRGPQVGVGSGLVSPGEVGHAAQPGAPPAETASDLTNSTGGQQGRELGRGTGILPVCHGQNGRATTSLALLLAGTIRGGLSLSCPEWYVMLKHNLQGLQAFRRKAVGLAINKVHQGDCIELLDKVESGSIDLAFADPPFNIGYQYDVYHDRRDGDEYIEWNRRWMAGVHKALKPDGTFWLAIGDEYAAELKVLGPA